MSIGIFGDSYADEFAHTDIANYPSWIDLLRERTRLNVTSYGTMGSSLWFSYKKFIENHKNFNQVIFVVTLPGRLTVPDYINVSKNSSKHINKLESVEFILKNKHFSSTQEKNALLAAKSYFEYLFDIKRENTFHSLLIEKIKSIRRDALLLYVHDNDPNTITLSKISKREVIGSGLSEDLFHKGGDRRVCHFCKENNYILANKIINWVYKKEKTVELKLEDFVIPDKKEIEHLLGEL
jgi:hypothetical protein